jgi:hypothetical protein
MEVTGGPVSCLIFNPLLMSVLFRWFFFFHNLIVSLLTFDLMMNTTNLRLSGLGFDEEHESPFPAFQQISAY